jgi:hypothetical protein
MDITQELQTLREELVREIDESIGQMLKKLQSEGPQAVQGASAPEKRYESLYPLSVGTGIYKGKRPTGVIFADGRREESPTWKKVVEILLKDCCKDSSKRQKLMNLRGRILGRNRVLLGSEKGRMRSPLKICEALYVETHYDAETLLRIVTTRILDAVDYDYSGIRIAVQMDS